MTVNQTYKEFIFTQCHGFTHPKNSSFKLWVKKNSENFEKCHSIK